MNQEPQRNPWLCLGIIGALALISLLSLVGVVLCALSGKETQMAAGAMTALISIGSGAVGSISSFLVMPPKGSVGIHAEDEKK